MKERTRHELLSISMSVTVTAIKTSYPPLREAVCVKFTALKPVGFI